MPKNRFALSLFWRTFILLGLLLTVSIIAWVQTFKALDFEPRAVQAAQQIASLVNLSRAGQGGPVGQLRALRVRLGPAPPEQGR